MWDAIPNAVLQGAWCPECRGNETPLPLTWRLIAGDCTTELPHLPLGGVQMIFTGRAGKIFTNLKMNARHWLPQTYVT
jgi:hypothetical protein